MRQPWPEEITQWLRDHVPGHTTREVVALIQKTKFPRKYGITFTEENIKNAKTRLHIKSGTKSGFPKGYSLKYPSGMLEYVKSIAQGKGNKELAELVNRKFGEGTITEKQMKTFKKNHKISSGLTGHFSKGHIPQNKGKTWDEQGISKEKQKKMLKTTYKKGNIPPNTKKVGEYSHTTDGYLIRKVQETGTQREKWEFVHLAVWEEHNGPVPEGCMITFADGNKDNCDISNLILETRAQHGVKNRWNIHGYDAESEKIANQIADLKMAVTSAKKRRKKAVQKG